MSICLIFPASHEQFRYLGDVPAAGLFPFDLFFSSVFVVEFGSHTQLPPQCSCFGVFPTFLPHRFFLPLPHDFRWTAGMVKLIFFAIAMDALFFSLLPEMPFVAVRFLAGWLYLSSDVSLVLHPGAPRMLRSQWHLTSYGPMATLSFPHLTL